MLSTMNEKRPIPECHTVKFLEYWIDKEILKPPQWKNTSPEKESEWHRSSQEQFWTMQ